MPLSLRWGLLSTARINRLVIPAIRASARSELTTVASRSLEKGRAYAAEWGIPRVLGSYEALLDDPEIDVVYIALPNSLHVDWTIRALAAGKHVLCEKPLALDVADVDRVAAAAARAGRTATEGFMYRHQPLTHAVEAVVRSGRLGMIRGIKGAFTFPLTREGDVRLDPALGGGSLWDVGCYPVSYACLVAGEAPSEVFGWQQTSASGVDLEFAGMLRFANGSWRSSIADSLALSARRWKSSAVRRRCGSSGHSGPTIAANSSSCRGTTSRRCRSRRPPRSGERSQIWKALRSMHVPRASRWPSRGERCSASRPCTSRRGTIVRRSSSICAGQPLAAQMCGGCRG